MKKLLFLTLFLLSLSNLSAQSVFINEFHYDNIGADSDEGWEISGIAGTNLNCYDIILYNGSTGASYSTITLSGIISDQQCGYGSISFLESGIQNGAPDGIALYNTCTSTLIQFLSYEGSFTATNGVANGVTSTDIGVTETGTTLVGQSLQLIGNGTTYVDFTWQSPTTNSMGTINTGQNFCTCPGLSTEPTNNPVSLAVTPSDCFSGATSWTIGADAANTLVIISATAITGSPADGVGYTASSNFGTGSTLNPGEYIIYNGNSNSQTITGLTENTTYFITAFSYNGTMPNCEENYLLVGTSTTFTTLAGCAANGSQITSILYNSCNGSSEGTDEIFTFTTGIDPVNIDDILIEYPNNTDYCNVGCGANTLINNPTYLNDLNVMAGCTIFTYADPIPAGTDVMVFTGNPPTTVLDYSSQCGASNLPIYALFNNNTSSTGQFANTGVRTLIVNFGGGITDTVTYNGSLQANLDGATVNFDTPGNANYFISTDCVFPLSVELVDFKAETITNFTNLKWTTTTERNNSHFSIEKSLNGYDFEEIGKISGFGNSMSRLNYNFTEYTQLYGTVYYRLKQVDFDGNSSYSYTIKLIGSNSTIYYSTHQIHFNFDTQQIVNIYNLSGQLIHSQLIQNEHILNWQHKGFFIVDLPNLQYRSKLICD